MTTTRPGAQHATVSAALAAPTIDGLRTVLARVLKGAYPAIWSRACDSASVAVECRDLDDDQFDSLLRALANQDRLCEVIAMSWTIRRTAARKLVALGR